MSKFVSGLLSLFVASGVVIGRGQKTGGNFLSDGDKADIIESVLELELGTQASIPDFANIREVSSDNIEFIEPSRLSKHGFTLVGASQLREAKKDHIVKYLVFRKILLRDGLAVVVLSRVTEGRPCFGAPFSTERRYTYESGRTAAGWVTQLIGRPVPVISFTLNYSAAKPRIFRAKPN